MKKEQTDYLSYLLRLWRVGGDAEKTVWRASLESSLTGDRKGFENLSDLFDFVIQQTDLALSVNGDNDVADS